MTKNNRIPIIREAAKRIEEGDLDYEIETENTYGWQIMWSERDRARGGVKLPTGRDRTALGLLST